MTLPKDIPGYRIVHVIGRGGMAIVYLAVQESLGREVALKLLLPQLAANAGTSERFLREGRIAASLDHRHIVSIHDFGIHEGQPYLTMEYLPDGTVADGAPYDPRTALEIARDIASALDHAHSAGVIHRDLKPENILKRKDGSFALADFGIARTLDVGSSKLTQEGATIGTPYYMSPEQLRSLPLDGRSDLYSLGVVLYELLTGQLPYRGSQDMPVSLQHIHASVPQLPPNLSRCQSLIDALMAKQPGQRPNTGADVAHRIDAVLTALTPQSTQMVPTGARSGALRPLLFTAAVLLLMLIVTLTWRLFFHSEAVSPGKPVASVSDVTTPAQRGIAVLPLVNNSGDKNEQFFSDGLSENLIVELSQFAGLKVIGRNSSFQFRDTKDDARTIGAKLGVAHLLEGSVQRAGEMVRISAELISTVDSSTLWSQRYDRPYKDLFALEDEITGAVARALKARLALGETGTPRGEQPPGGSLDAYNAYLHGKFNYARNTEADIRKAIEYFTKATQLDPHYARAFAMLSHAWIVLASQYVEGSAAQQANGAARAAADTALALAPDLAAAHLARGTLLQTADFDWHGAETEYRRAAGLEPDDSLAKQRQGYMLATLGQIEPAIDLTRQALATDPLNALWHVWLGLYLIPLDRLDEAETVIRKAIELQPGAAGFYYQLTIVQIQRGNAAAALATARQEQPSIFQDIALAWALQIGDDHAAADAALRVLTDKYAGSAAYQIAEVYALRGDADRAFEWLDRAWTNRDSGIVYLLYDPFLLRYKGDPRFAAFCRKARLPAPGEHVAM